MQCGCCDQNGMPIFMVAYYPNFTVGGRIFKREKGFFAITSFDIGIWMVVLLLWGASIPTKSYSGRHFIQVLVVVQSVKRPRTVPNL